MMNRLLKLALLSAAAALPLLSTAAASAQSMPAGQVSKRMAAQAKPANQTAAIDAVVKTNAQVADAMAHSAPGDESAVLQAFCVDDVTADLTARDAALGAGRLAAWNKVVEMDQQYSAPTAKAICAARSVADAIQDYASLALARRAAMAAKDSSDKALGTNSDDKVQEATQQILNTLKNLKCAYYTGTTTPTKASPNFQYPYRFLLPLVGPGCTNDAIQNFFSVNGSTQTVNNVQYLYNAQQSASQLGADLLTATFAPGVQAVLAGTATAGTSQSTTSSSSGTATTTTTDSVATAVAKLQSGGDFNVRFPMPILYVATTHGSVEGLFSPNVGFNINGFSGQSTITEATEYSLNLPFEVYAQTASISGSSNSNTAATLFLDLKPAGEFISSALAKSLGPSVPKSFFLGQASVGIEFAQSVRISFQYIYGNPKIYQSASTTTTSTTSATPATTTMNGFHLSVSFSPQKSTSSSN
jgi:hypothetical protein